MDRVEMIQWLKSRGIQTIDSLSEQEIRNIVMGRMEKEAISS